MTIKRCLLICILFAPFIACAESNLWSRIEELSRNDTPRGNPPLEAFLKKLTPSEMLQAARECCLKAETRVPKEKWEEGVLAVSIALTFYGDAEGGLTDAALNALLSCVGSDKEGALFRELLLRLLHERYWQQLAASQQQQGKKMLLAILVDRKSPDRLRCLSCEVLTSAIVDAYTNVIYSDTNVRPLRNDKAKWRNLNSLIKSGEVTLDSETRKSLKIIRGEIQSTVAVLKTVSEATDESSEVKARISIALKAFDELPEVPEK